ncbi:DNA repair protein RAD51 homolog 4-like isoform X2 [Anneissia japonica]|uniref:DNA repair protein RAD51 homolog 4-like isoform X2 n=1 Tax=Anneissia japonica TaxID=1529436 RepID=UPI0014257A99|nr:DNA repair protein RAD51 homolog 4-like isoform X2 [Anneissia japonica]
MSILCPGTCSELSTDNINILRSVGIRTVVDFLAHSPDQIANKCSFSHTVVSAIRRALLAQHASLVVSGSNIYHQVSQKLTILHTGIQSIDNLLSGGLLSTELTELAGASAAGKTQLCLAVAARTSLVPKHCVLYISTGADFSSERLRELMILSGSPQKNLSEALEQVKCIHAFDVFRLLEVLHNLPALIHNDSVFYAHLKLVIVDSIAAVIAPIIGGKQIEGHGLMMQVARKLKEIVVEENIAALEFNKTCFGSILVTCTTYTHTTDQSERRWYRS